MAFFVQLPAKRNLMGEGIMQGMMQGSEDAAQRRQWEMSQEYARQQQSKDNSVLRDFLQSQGSNADPRALWQGVQSLDIPDRLKESALDSFLKMNNNYSNAAKKYKESLGDTVRYFYGGKTANQQDRITPELQMKINAASAFTSASEAQGRDRYESLLDFEREWNTNPEFQAQMLQNFGGMQQSQQQSAQGLVETPKDQAPADPLAQTPDFNPDAKRQRMQTPNEIRLKEQDRKQDALYRKETAVYRNDLSKDEQGARESIAKLETLKKLNSEGNVKGPFVQKFRELTGMDYGAFQTADEQQMEGLINQFFAGAGGLKDLMGAGQLSDRDVMTFKKTLPSLLQSKEGRERVIDMLIAMRKVKIERNKVANDILDEAKQSGQPHPYDLQARVDKRMPPVYEQLTKELKESAGIKSKKVQPGTPISKDLAREYLREAGGDKEKARAFAKEDGYDF